jgi:hypothetical protein
MRYTPSMTNKTDFANRVIRAQKLVTREVAEGLVSSRLQSFDVIRRLTDVPFEWVDEWIKLSLRIDKRRMVLNHFLEECFPKLGGMVDLTGANYLDRDRMVETVREDARLLSRILLERLDTAMTMPEETRPIAFILLVATVPKNHVRIWAEHDIWTGATLFVNDIMDIEDITRAVESGLDYSLAVDLAAGVAPRL